MARRGPKPKTAANSRRQSSGPVSWAGVKAPDRLEGESRDEYERVVKLLSDAGTLGRTDPRMVDLYVLNSDLARRASADIDRDGMTLTTRRGAIIPHPMLAVFNSATLRLKAIINDLGLTPASSRHSAMPAGDGGHADRWAGLLDVVGTDDEQA